MQHRYLRRNGHPFATLQINTMGDDVCIVASVCGKQDQFSRKIGKLITHGRMKFFIEHPDKCYQARDLSDLLKNPRRHVLRVNQEELEDLFRDY